MSQYSEFNKISMSPSKYVRDAIVKCIESGLVRLENSGSNSLLKRFFTREIFDKLKLKNTSYGATLLDCINAGVEDLDLVIGIYAVDPECYEVFADLFIPIIEEYHKIDKTIAHPITDVWGYITDYEDLDPHGQYVVTTGVKCFRNLKGYPFGALMTEVHYREIELKMCIALGGLTGELRGTYHSLSAMHSSIQAEFVAENYFKHGKRVLGAADINQGYPTGRGVFYNKYKTFMVYVGEEDHVIMMSMQRGGNLGRVLNRLIEALDHFKEWMEFSIDERFGYLTSCPSNLGQSVRPYFQIKLPKLSTNMPKLQEMAATYDMKVIEIVEECINVEHVYELQNAKCFGCTEYQSLKKMWHGVNQILDAERRAK